MKIKRILFFWGFLCYLIVACSSNAMDKSDKPIVNTPNLITPQVSIVNVVDVTVNSATINVKIEENTNLSIVTRGVCINKQGNPTIENDLFVGSTSIKGNGVFTVHLTKLEGNTQYYVRGYAANSAMKEAYGEAVLFKTGVDNSVIIPPVGFPYVFAKKPLEGKNIYIPNELKSNDFSSNLSRWSYQRSASSDNVIVFWESGFGQYPNLTAKESMRVDVKNILDQAENYYSFYRNQMKFLAGQNTNLDNYRMIVMINYQEEWLATGSGYDNIIGALWINPTTVKHPAAIAHEFGHSFQYQIHCDGSYGFRDQNYVGTFWEQCAQYMSWQQNNTAFLTEIPYLLKNIHKNFSHEDIRYQSMYLMEYWREKHGVEFLGKLWSQAKTPEGPLQAYMRLAQINQEQFNNEVFEYACKNITWDYPLGSFNRDYIKTLSSLEQKKYKHSTKLDLISNNVYQISASQSPQSYGYNAIKLSVPVSGSIISVNFEGLESNQWKYIAGWRWGFVSINNDGSPEYHSMQKLKQGTATISITQNTKEVWFVVTGAPLQHLNHVWDNDSTNDENFPYKLNFNNTVPIEN